MTDPALQKLNDNFDLFVGIDQTGAACMGGAKAKPLPVAILDLSNESPRLLLTAPNGKPLSLKSFTRSCFIEMLTDARVADAERRVRSSRTAILADCVLGLPLMAWPGNARGAEELWRLFERAAEDTSERKGYGLTSAANYFADILGAPYARTRSMRESYPVRECERLSGANSVFRTYPYQKNIQCGTYRIWRDLGMALREDQDRWLNIRYFETKRTWREERPWMFEAWPSLMWRRYLGFKSRKREDLVSRLTELVPYLDVGITERKLIACDADRADAAVLALGGWLMQKRGDLFGSACLESATGIEGWIVGLFV